MRLQFTRLLFGSPPLGAALAALLTAAPALGALSTEVEIQARMVEDCTTLLDQLLGPGRAKVVIRLQGEHNEIKTQTEFLTPVKSSATAATLPGFMVSRLMEKTYDLVQRDQEQSTRTSSFAIKKIEAFIVIDERTPPQQVRAVQRVLSDLLRLESDRGDRLDMIPIRMLPAWKSALLSAEGTRVFLILGGALGLMVVGAFLAYLTLVRPGRRTLEALVQRRMGAAAEPQAPAGQAGRGPGPSLAEPFPEGIPRLLSALEPGASATEGPALLTQRFAFLESRRPEELAEILSVEQPEDLALVFAHLAESNPTLSALVFSSLAAPLQTSVSAALANLRVADPERLGALEERLRTQAELQVRGSDRLGNIISLLSPERRDALLNELSAGDPQARERVGRTLLPFEALEGLKPEEFRRLLTRVPYQEWAVALKGAPVALSGKVLEAFPEGTRALISEAMEEPQPRARVMAIRSRILQQAMSLASEGKLTLGPDAGLGVG